MVKSFRKVLWAIGALFIAGAGYTQSTSYAVTLPDIIPASPEPSAFMKAGLGSVNMSSGGVNASIPLYTIKLRDFSFPISLAYSTTGLKADEACSRVGLGWVLNATAMVTRSVKGKPDEFCSRGNNKQADFNSNADSVYNYYMDATSETSVKDMQPDEFSFNCNGYSGKFVLDDNYIPRITSTSNVKIDMTPLVTPGSTAGNIGIIYITTPDGVKYRFGDSYEITTGQNQMFNSSFKLVTKTAFFLSSITLPSGDHIDFSYEALNITVPTGSTQTLVVSSVNGELSCGDCTSRNSYSSQSNWISYNTKYLTGITTSDGQSISFSYENQPDYVGDKRLTSMIVQALKEIRFNYYDVPGAGINEPLGRFFLTKVRDIKMDADVVNIDSSYDYIFTYNNLTEVPLPITFAQDYLGYYNGQTSNNCLIPPSLNSNNTIDFTFRNPSSPAAMVGSLSSIQYPTGGREEFFYEGNTSGKYVTAKVDSYIDLTLNGLGYQTYTYNSFNVLKNHTATLTALAVDSDPNDTYLENEGHNTIILRLYDNSNNTVVASTSVNDLNTSSTTVSLLAGHSYKLELVVKSSIVNGFGTLHYDPTSTDTYHTYYEETTLPGIRIKQIKYTDLASFNTYSKYYKYASIDDLVLSSGGLYLNTVFHSVATSKNYCGTFGAFETSCLLNIYSSNSSNDVYGTAGSGSLVYYSSVIESDDPDFKNGGTQYTFFNNEMGGNHLNVHGNDILYLPQGQYPTLSGTVATKKIFNSSMQVVEKEENEYETVIDLDPTTYSVYVKKNWEPWPTREDRTSVFDVDRSHYGSWWIRQKSKTITSYSGTNTMVNKTDYTYGTDVNILPVTVTTKDSKGIEIKTESKYPTDFATEPVNGKLIRRNIISPVLQQTSYRNGVLLQQKKTSYRDWFGDSTVIQPDTIKTRLSPADQLQPDLVFTSYDTKGNPKGLQKVQNMHLVYLWDDKHALPVCEVTNAALDEVAFASFEEGTGYGNWTLSSGAASSGTAFTGNYIFSGTLTKSISTAGVYIVRLWTTSSATVNSAAGTLLRTARGWSLYEWKLTNPSSVSVQGTNLDDIRLYPQGAIMKTFTYKPFVGMTSQSDERSNVTYIFYDDMSRLSMIKDIDYNVLKKYEYDYIHRNTTANSVWYPTGNTRCKPCPLNAAYYSNVQEREEKDINSSSSTYNQTRWVEVGIEGSCVSNAVWQNTSNLRCAKDASNYNTGIQEREQVDVNPCSNTYNQSKWVTVGTNTTACPLPCPDCTTIDKKCIGGVCVTGVQNLVSSTQTGTNTWTCVYRYDFPDGSYSATYTVTSTAGCPID